MGPALAGVDVAYYLVHSTGRGSDGNFAERDQEGAANFATVASAAGTRRIVYLSGLGEGSEHLDSRNATAETLRGGKVPVAYFRAAAVIGAGSESFRTVYYLVKRLPLMVTPRWVSTPTQPIAAQDVVAYLAAASDLDADLDRDLQIAGLDVTSYDGMIDELAAALKQCSPPRVSVPGPLPQASSLWISLITPSTRVFARPLGEGTIDRNCCTDPLRHGRPAADRTHPTDWGRCAMRWRRCRLPDGSGPDRAADGPDTGRSDSQRETGTEQTPARRLVRFITR